MISSVKLHLKQSILEAISFLCKSHLQHANSITIEGLLGITIDSNQVYLINIFESVNAGNKCFKKSADSYQKDSISNDEIQFDNQLNNEWNVKVSKPNVVNYNGKFLKTVQCLPSFEVFASSDSTNSEIHKTQKNFQDIKSFSDERNNFTSYKLMDDVYLNLSMADESLNRIPSNSDFYDLPPISDVVTNKFISSVEDLVDLIGDKDVNYEMESNISLLNLAANSSTFNSYESIKSNTNQQTWLNNEGQLMSNNTSSKTSEIEKESTSCLLENEISICNEIGLTHLTKHNEDILNTSNMNSNDQEQESAALFKDLSQTNDDLYEKSDKSLQEDGRWSILMLETEADTLEDNVNTSYLLSKEMNENSDLKMDRLLDEDDLDFTSGFDEATFNEMAPLNLAGPQDLSVDITKLVVCRHCGKSFKDKIKLKKHKCKANLVVQSNRLVDAVILEPLNLKSQPIKPLDLTVSHTADGSLVYHRSLCGRSGDTNEVVCVCGRRFPSYSFYVPHTSSCSKARMTPYRSCESCGKLLFSSSGYAKHRKKHIGVFKFKCPLCKKGFFDQTQLSAHVDSQHSKVRRYPCINGVCAKSFFWKHHLKRHLLVCSESIVGAQHKNDEHEELVKTYDNYEDVPSKKIKVKLKNQPVKKKKVSAGGDKNFMLSTPVTETLNNIIYMNLEDKLKLNKTKILTFKRNSANDLTLNNSLAFSTSDHFVCLPSNSSIDEHANQSYINVEKDGDLKDLNMCENHWGEMMKTEVLSSNTVLQFSRNDEQNLSSKIEPMF